MPTPSIIIPGFYPGAGQAKLLNMNQQCMLFDKTRALATQASVAVQMSRMPHAAYPWGAAAQVLFSGAPGTFEIDIEASEDDQEATYVSIVTIVAVNSLNAGRCSLGFTYPKFIRAKVITLTNDVLTSLWVTR